MALAVQILTALGAIAAALVLGGMVAFAGLFARLLFRLLPDETSRPLLRRMFPAYYQYMLGAAAAGAVFLLPTGRLVDSALLAMAAIGFAVANWWFLPQANHLSDQRAPDRHDIEAAFMNVQMRSARLGLLQAGVTIAVLVRLVVWP